LTRRGIDEKQKPTPTRHARSPLSGRAQPPIHQQNQAFLSNPRRTAKAAGLPEFDIGEKSALIEIVSIRTDSPPVGLPA